MKRLMKAGVDGCGLDEREGACPACSIRALRRKGRRWRQLLPLHYCTFYTTGGENADQFANFTTWRMWFGRVFAYKNAQYPISGSVTIET